MPSFGARLTRIIPFGLAACALGVMVVQNAGVTALLPSDPDTAAAIWPSHPSVRLVQASRQIAADSGAGREIRAASFDLLEQVARRAPLEPQPFIVAGIRAQLAGRPDQAIRAFEAARLRDPRALPARYFLATARLQRGDVEGLRDVAALTRLEPGSGTVLVPYLADLARQPRSREAMRAMFRGNPAIRQSVLSSLARDPANVGLVMALGQTTNPKEGPWLRTMLDTLVSKRRYGEARTLWGQISGVRAAGLFDGDFRNASAPPPFNWELTSSSLGLAERRSGRLQVMYYGQDSGTLARQLLTLDPGRYRLGAPTSGSDGSGAIHWLVRCDSGNAGEIGRAPAGRGGLVFVVPGGCGAQWLELNARASDFGREADMSIGPVTLAPEAEQ